jgi:hypothetical protein
MNTRKTLLTVLALALLAATLAPVDAGAIPAFARRHKLSCTTCHAPFPRLKPFGEEFAGNGFMLPEDEKDRDYIIAGDELMRLNKDFPLAARFDAWAYLDEDSEITSDMQTPWGVKLLSGGTLAENVGYYFYFYMQERGEVAGIEDAYIHFNDVGGSALDVMVGQFQTSDPLMKRELRLTYEDYQFYKTTIGDSRNNLAYDRGVMLTYGFAKTGTDLVGMVVNGNGKPEAGDNRKFDDDKYKNYGARISQGLGEYLRVGYFYYYGEEKLIAPAGTEPFRSLVRYHGPDATIGNGMLDLNLQYMLRGDTNPLFEVDPVKVDTDGIVAELVISPRRDRSRQYFTVLYNRIDSDLDANDYETWTGGFTHLFARTLRGSLEFTYDAERETSRGGVGLVAAF